MCTNNEKLSSSLSFVRNRNCHRRVLLYPFYTSASLTLNTFSQSLYLWLLFLNGKKKEMRSASSIQNFQKCMHNIIFCCRFQLQTRNMLRATSRMWFDPNPKFQVLLLCPKYQYLLMRKQCAKKKQKLYHLRMLCMK